MPLEIRPLSYDDIPTFAALDAAAMANWALAKAMENDMPADQTRQEWITRFTQQGYQDNERVRWVKVVDTGAGAEGEMVAVALWRFQFEQEEVKEDGPKGVDVDESAPVAEVVVGTEKGEGEVKEAKRPSVMCFLPLEPPAQPRPIIPPTIITNPLAKYPGRQEAMHEQSRHYTQKYIHGQPHAHLSILVTHPSHQRRGAGSMLVNWGCALADQAGLMQTLHASAAGLGVYEKCGFRVVETREMDLRPWGVEEVEVRRYMIRDPPARSS